MILYILPILYCFFAIYYFDILGNRRQRLVCYYVVLIYIVFLSGLSYRVGGDTIFYAEAFRDIPTLHQISWKEFLDTTYQPLYFLLCVVCKSITEDFWFMHLCQSWIVCSVCFYFIRKETDYIFSGALLFIGCIYPYFCFEILKESLAICMTLLGYLQLQKKNYYKFYVFAVLAFLFHFSGVIAFFIPLMRRIKLNKFFFLWMLAMLGVMLFINNYISNMTIFGDMIAEKYAFYMDVAGERNNNWIIVAFIRYVLIPLFAFIWLRWTYRKVNFEWAYCTYILFGIGTLGLGIIFERPINYVLPFVVVSLCDLLGVSYRRRISRHIATVLVCLLFWVGCRGIFYMREEIWRLLIPYESVFSERQDPLREKVIRKIHP